MSIGERLREERVRLGFSQTELADIGGVGKRTQINYEAHEGAPDARYLERVEVKGIDVLYVITGRRLVHVDVLRSVIGGVEEGLKRMRLVLPPDKKAELISVLYNHFHRSESVDREAFRTAFLRLVA